ncbi:MAG: hypothetical protein EB078_02725 [Proteobacteria bacterium]|nr:hypothetical protein [Pseudomonadota bacterium]NDC25518.1 hypothetical protein [Pseudomonadota bacterium]NDD03797.1 hypothetical protein [Pseudomonadota bacterium]NDG27662.1 hypothetical protein [Pseudomonadota bacterium]
MKQPSKREIEKLKKEALDTSKWEKVSGFEVGKPTSIRLPPELISSLQKIAKLRGERSYQTLLKKWLLERATYEIELVQLARGRK